MKKLDSTDEIVNWKSLKVVDSTYFDKPKFKYLMQDGIYPHMSGPTILMRGIDEDDALAAARHRGFNNPKIIRKVDY